MLSVCWIYCSSVTESCFCFKLCWHTFFKFHFFVNFVFEFHVACNRTFLQWCIEGNSGLCYLFRFLSTELWEKSRTCLQFQWLKESYSVLNMTNGSATTSVMSHVHTSRTLQQLAETYWIITSGRQFEIFRIFSVLHCCDYICKFALNCWN